MSCSYTLTLTGDQHERLRAFLFPGDGKEAVAFALCGRCDGERRHRLLIREIHEIPYVACLERSVGRVTWLTDTLAPILDRATDEGLSVIKIHSHPSGYSAFSATDDVADRELLPMIRGWVEVDIPHGSIVMLPDGQMFGRVIGREDSFISLEAINVVGDDLHFWYADAGTPDIPDFMASHGQLFGEGTTERLRRLSIAVIGCSGTGGPVIEQLTRLGVGELVLIEDDRIEARNVNRIPHSTMEDAKVGRLKVEVMAEAVRRIGLGTRVITVPKNLWDPESVKEVAQCDLVFGCMDSIDGRYLLNTLATYYMLPYFDLGVRLVAVPEKKSIREVCGTVHYLQPGRSSLMSRGLFTMDQVGDAGLLRNDPGAWTQKLGDGYISGVQEYRPAVISVNMHLASLAVNELLARLHPYREELNSAYASVAFSLSSMEYFYDPEEANCEVLSGRVGIGDTRPLLGLMELAERRAT